MKDKKTVWNVRKSVRLLLGMGILGVGMSLCSFDSLAAEQLVEVEEMFELSASTDLPAGAEELLDLAAGEVEPMQNQNATVTGGDINIRAGAGTNFDRLVKAPRGTAMVISGRTTGSDGQIWYQVSLTVDGNAFTGFIRSDYAELGDVIPEPEPEPTPEQTPEQVPEQTPEQVPEQVQGERPPLYYVEQIMNNDGTTDWYLCDTTNYKEGVDGEKPYKGEQYEMTAVMLAIKDYVNMAKQVEQYKYIIIALVVVVIVLILGVTLLLFKVKDSSRDDDDEDDDDEINYEDAPPVRRKRTINEEGTPVRRTSQGEGRPVRRTVQDGERPVRRTQQEGQPRPKQGSRPVQRTEKPQTGESARRQTAQTTRQRTAAPRPKEREVTYEEEPETGSRKDQNGAWRSKNFLTEDDEFEFEFLNMDDPNKL